MDVVDLLKLFFRYNTPSNKILCRETDYSIEKIKQKNGGHGQSKEFLLLCL